MDVAMCGKIFILLCLSVFPGVLSYPGTLLKVADDYPKCKSSLEKLFDGVTNGELWALKILDSSTKLPSGILTGHLRDFGNFDECFENQTIIKTHYCSVKINLPFTLQNQSLSVEWGYCVPASCPEPVLQQILNEIATEWQVNATIVVNNCTTNEKKTMNKSDMFGIYIWVIWLCVVCLSTMYDVAMKILQKQSNSWLSSFSVYSNGKKLINVKETPETLTPLHGLKFLSICWIILGHRFFYTIMSPLINFTDFAKELRYIKSQFFVQGVLAVDTFFFLSGLLNSFHLLKKIKKSKRFPIFKYYFHRYIRLTPSLAAVVIMYATWYTLLGSGSEWDKVTGVWKQFCVDNWWPTLLYINNYYNPMAQCAGQSWYLAADMQLFWLSPLMIIPLWKRPKWGKLFIYFLLIVSVIIQFQIAYAHKFRMPFTFGLGGEDDFEVIKYLYLPTHTRATPYIFGIIFGYYLEKLQSSKTIVVMPKIIVIVLWFFSTFVCLAVFLGNFQFSRPLEDHPYNRLESSFYISLHRVGWSLGIGWIVFACLNKCGGFVNSILSWKCFIPLSRLSYCMFLTHMAIQQFHIGTARTSDYFQYFNQVHQFFGDLCLSILAAVILSLMFESPPLILLKLIFKEKQNKKPKGETNEGFEESTNKPQKEESAIK